MNLVAIASLCLLFVLVGGISASVDTTLFKNRFKATKGILVGLFCQFVLLPFLGFCTVRGFDLSDVLGITLIATTCSPGGAYSNWWCSLFNADLALSVAMTTCSTIMSVIFMPLNLFLYVRAAYGASLTLEWWKLLVSLGTALAAICAGLALSYMLPFWRNRFNMVGNLAGLALIIFGALTSSRDDPIWDKEPGFYAAVSLPCVTGLLSAFALSWCCGLEAPQRVAVTVETSYQNTGIAITMAMSSFPPDQQSTAAGVPIFYGLVGVLVLPVFLLISWRLGMTYAPVSDGIFRVILQSYQPQSPTGASTGRPPVNSQEILTVSPTPVGKPAGPCVGPCDAPHGSAGAEFELSDEDDDPPVFRI